MRTYFHGAACCVVLACGRESPDTHGPRDTAAVTHAPNADSLATVQVARAALVAAPGNANVARDSVTIFRLDTAGIVLRFGRPAVCGPVSNCYRPSAVVVVRPNGKAEIIPGFKAGRFLGLDSAR